MFQRTLKWQNAKYTANANLCYLPPEPSVVYYNKEQLAPLPTPIIVHVISLELQDGA